MREEGTARYIRGACIIAVPNYPASQQDWSMAPIEQARRFMHPIAWKVNSPKFSKDHPVAGCRPCRPALRSSCPKTGTYRPSRWGGFELSWYIEALKKYAVFGGRSRRTEYWYFVLFNIIVSLVLGWIDALLGTS